MGAPFIPLPMNGRVRRGCLPLPRLGLPRLGLPRLGLPRLGLSELAAALAIATWFGGCSTLTNDISRARTAYEEARYEDAQVWLDDLAARSDGSVRERAQLAYLQGMTAYRLSREADARYFLGLARELVDGRAEALLGQSAAQTMTRTLSQLEEDAVPTQRQTDRGQINAGSPEE